MDPSFASQRAALEAAFQEYDSVLASSSGKDVGAANADLAVVQHRIMLASKALTTASTPPGVFVLDMVFYSLLHSAVVTAVQLKIFDLVQSEIQIDELAAKTGADRVLLLRIMRVLASSAIFTHPQPDVYGPTRLSRKFTEPNARDWSIGSLQVMNKMGIEMPGALAADGFKNPENAATAAMTKAFGMTAWEMLAKDERARLMFDSAMAQQDDLPEVMVPDREVAWNEMLEGVADGEVAFVDVGGGNGHVIRKLLGGDGVQLKGRFVLEDMQSAVDTVQYEARSQGETLPYECVVQDFFEKQKIEGARVYHIRRCLHDWSDDKCEVILRNIREAMRPGFSKVLIHEFVLPVMNAEPREVLFDMLMMCLTGLERDEKQWEALLGRSGLRIVKVWRAKAGHMGIIEAEVA